MAASQNSRSGSTPKTHRRSRPPIQTCDPDLTIQTCDPDLWSRPLASFRLGLLIQTPCFILEWTCWILPHPFPYGWTVALEDMLSSCLLRLACYSCLACSLLLAAARLEHFGSRPVTKIWSKSAYPVPDLVPHRSRPVPDRSRSFRHRSMESNLMEEEVSGQCKIFWFFLSRIHADYHDSIHSVPDVRNRRFTKVAVQDVRITAERSRPVYRPIPMNVTLKFQEKFKRVMYINSINIYIYKTFENKDLRDSHIYSRRCRLTFISICCWGQLQRVQGFHVGQL